MTQPLIARHWHRPGARQGTAWRRTGRVGLRTRFGIRMLATVALIGAAVAFTGLFDSSSAAAADGACEGVTVVVDFTDTGGDLSIACAEGDQESGRAALLAAGFSTTDSQPGLLCAINSMPDPCPETFDGNFWSYWNSTPTSEWKSYEVGADSSTPAAGTIEGWRYNDGTTAPGIAPAEAAAALAASSPSSPETAKTPEAAPGSDEAVTTSTLADERADQGTVLAVTAVAFLALIAALAVFFVMRKRRGSSQAGHSTTAAPTADSSTASSSLVSSSSAGSPTSGFPRAGSSPADSSPAGSSTTASFTEAESRSNDPEARD